MDILNRAIPDLWANLGELVRGSSATHYSDIGFRVAGKRDAITAVPRAVPWWYIYLVRVKTSITLPRDLLASIDQVNPNRSAFVELAARAYLAQLDKAKREARDREIINRHAKRLNAEAMDILDYQRIP